MQSEEIFREIVSKLTGQNEELTEGKMMSSPALKMKNKVIAFYHNEAMTFKFGKETELYKSQYQGSTYLSPFKNKPPMKGWLVIPAEFNQDWLRLTNECVKMYS